jgi:hypothetical protein
MLMNMRKGDTRRCWSTASSHVAGIAVVFQYLLHVNRALRARRQHVCKAFSAKLLIHEDVDNGVFRCREWIGLSVGNRSRPRRVPTSNARVWLFGLTDVISSGNGLQAC